MTLPIEPYRPRRIEPLGVVERAGWTIKVIGITASADLPDDTEIAAALEVTERELPREWNSGPADPYERDFRTAPGSRADDSFVAMWKSSGRAGAQRIDRPARHPAIGFCIVHRGAEALWVLVCWWDLDLMYERLWRADLGSTDLRPVPPDGPTACVWELEAIGHERQAWIDHVLTSPSTPDYAAYLAATLTIAGPTP